MPTFIYLPPSGFTLRDLEPVSCGCEQCTGGQSFGPAVREFYLIHCVLGGEGTLQYGARTYRVGAGKCFLIYPGDMTYYRADSAAPWRYVWLGFRGKLAGELLTAAGLNKNCPLFGSGEILSLFNRLYEEIRSDKIGTRSTFRLLSVLYELFGLLPGWEKPEPAAEHYIRTATDLIATMYACRLTIQRIADCCGLDRSYFCRLFARQTGKTPQRYLIEVRMEKAKMLLRTTNLSVCDTARSVGYQDICNFYRMFRKYAGVTPCEYRKGESGLQRSP